MDALREAICRAGRRLWERGLVGACEGNISVRVDETHLLCTPSGVAKGDLTPESLVVTDLSGHPIEGGVPSSELKLHLRCYARRSDCRAVVHAHPSVATAFSVAELAIPIGVLPEADILLGPVALCPFGLPGTNAVPDSLEPFLEQHDTFLLSHHGAATLGRTLTEAVDRMETLERVATVLLHAHGLGGWRPLAAEDAAAVAELAQRVRL